ncbi:MAG: cytochrome P460 family protein [Acidobacteriota bacterium]
MTTHLPKRRRRLLLDLTICLVAAALLLFTGLLVAPLLASEGGKEGDVVPIYDDRGRLELPREIERWVLAGSSLGLSYTENDGGDAGAAMFHHTLIEPTAYEHFRNTGTFRDGTMLALLLHPQGRNEMPSRSGEFADELAFVEMAVKDEQQGGWAYYNFGSPGSRAAASALPERSCKSCHDTNAAYDNVFLQFYPLLRSAAPESSPAQAAWIERTSAAGAVLTPAGTSEPAAAALALSGLDPVLLTEGREEEGKAEIEVEHEGFVYRFLSEPTRRRFTEDPERYSIQNDSCPVVEGAAIDPSLVAVHRGRIYAFATPGCILTFQADPESFLTGDSDEDPSVQD